MGNGTGRDQLELVATVTRFSSIVSPYFGRLGRLEEAYPVDAIVQSAWRELGGGEDESARRAMWHNLIVRLDWGGMAQRSSAGEAVSIAIRGVALVAESWNEAGSAEAAKRAGVEIAEAFDRGSFVDSEISEPWLSYERSCAERVAEIVADESVFLIRMEAGAQSMPYRRALLDNVDV